MARADCCRGSKCFEREFRSQDAATHGLNLIHVDDAVTAVEACVKHAGVAGTFNVVDDQPIERRTYFELLAQLVGAPCPTFDPAQASARGSGGINKRCANQKVSKDLAWRPTYSSIATGLPASVSDSVV